MHILTKVFVLIASILSILMAALTISFAANVNEVTSDYQRAVAVAEAAEGALAAKNDTTAREVAQMSQEKERLQQEKAELESRLKEAEGQIGTLTREVRAARQSRDSIEGKIAQLGVTAETQASLIAEYKREVQRLRDGELDWREEKLDLEEALSDRETQIQVFNASNRALREQLTDAQRAIVQARGGESADTTLAVEIPGPPIRGTVQEVRTEEATGDTIVRISLGENDRVRTNSKLFLNRNGQTYLGDVIVFETDLDFAVGRIRNLQPGQQIRQGDQVWSQLGS